MSHEFPVFTFCIDYSAVHGKEIGLFEALDLVPKEHWLSSSRNWWYQGLVAKVLNAYSGFETLRYLTDVVAVIEPEQLAAKEKAIYELIRKISEQTEIFVRLSCCNASSPADEVRENVEAVRANIKEAEVLRAFDDDSRFAYGNFFSFLVSHAAALNEAHSTGKCLIYALPQP